MFSFIASPMLREHPWVGTIVWSLAWIHWLMAPSHHTSDFLFFRSGPGFLQGYFIAIICTSAAAAFEQDFTFSSRQSERSWKQPEPLPIRTPPMLWAQWSRGMLAWISWLRIFLQPWLLPGSCSLHCYQNLAGLESLTWPLVWLVQCCGCVTGLPSRCSQGQGLKELV